MALSSFCSAATAPSDFPPRRSSGYPASLVKLFFMVAAEAWLAEGRLPPTRELRDAVAAMIAWSSNDATSIVVDLLTRTTSGPALPPAALARWLARRRILNRYFAGWRRPEFTGINLAQKTWYEAPYGREHQSCFAGAEQPQPPQQRRGRPAAAGASPRPRSVNPPPQPRHAAADGAISRPRSIARTPGIR